MAPLEKVKTIEELGAILAEARKAQKTVVFANGCFDVIHVGHVRYLQGARAQGDLLIVGINSDDSVRALKGIERPLQSQDERAEILGSFECVDYVIMFDETTVDRILLELEPDIHAKGTDYTSESVPERATVRSYGGKVAIVGDTKLHSSRDMIARILDNFRS